MQYIVLEPYQLTFLLPDEHLALYRHKVTVYTSRKYLKNSVRTPQ
jgi:hypothetical protein